MTEPKFTPGPWTAVQHGDGIYTWTITGNDEMEDRSLAIVGVGTPNLQRDEANMHLIAAAPEMYELLDDVRRFMFIIGSPLNAERIEEVLRKARGDREVSE